MNHIRDRRVLAAAVLLACAAVVVLAGVHPATAEESDMRAMRTKYPGIVGTRLDACDVCHNSPRYSLDPYGRAFSQARRDFAAIEGLDSDGDGYTNLAEIQALTFPGHPDDFPAPTATPVTATATVTVTATTSVTVTPTATPTLGHTLTPTPDATPAFDYHLFLPWSYRPR